MVVVVPDDLRPASSLPRQGGNNRTGCLAAASRAQTASRAVMTPCRERAGRTGTDRGAAGASSS